MRGQRARDKGPSLYYYRDESICLTLHILWFKFPIPHTVPLGITSEHRTRNNHWSLPGVWHPNEQTDRAQIFVLKLKDPFIFPFGARNPCQGFTLARHHSPNELHVALGRLIFPSVNTDILFLAWIFPFQLKERENWTFSSKPSWNEYHLELEITRIHGHITTNMKVNCGSELMTSESVL